MTGGLYLAPRPPIAPMRQGRVGLEVEVSSPGDLYTADIYHPPIEY